MNMERERGRPFFACIFTRRKQREIISILPAGVFEETEKCCSPLSLTLSKDACFLPTEILLSFASFCHPSIHPSLSPHSTPFTARQGYPIPHSSHLLYPLACEISLLNPAFFPSPLPPFKRRPSVRSSCVDPVFELSTTFPHLFLSLSSRIANWSSFKLAKLKLLVSSRETLEASFSFRLDIILYIYL